MSIIVSVVVAAIALYCAIRAVLPSHSHRRDVAAWHTVMALAMIVMLRGPDDEWTVTATQVVFVLCLCWSVWRLVEQRARAAYLGLVAGSAAMIAMVASPASAHAHSHTHDAAGETAASMGGTMTGGMADMNHTTTGHAHGHASAGWPTRMLVVALVVGLVVVSLLALLRIAARRTSRLHRLDATCEGIMAGTMSVMLVAML